MPQFVLKVNLGNDAMTKAHELADAISNVEWHIRRGNNYDIIEPQEHNVRDRNGNTVGSWQVK